MTEFAANGTFKVNGVERAIARPGIAALCVRLDRIELYDAGRRITPEKRTLRATEYFDAVKVEDRETLEDRVLEDDVVIDEADGL